jgi:succinate dehydrogenase / fumarate reductase flavoprotein subunit
VGPLKNGVYLDFADAIEREGDKAIEERYSNLFEMYERITDEDPYHVPMRIYPAPHYIMGGLWVDYNLMTTIPGLYAIGEANFSDHGANRLGASALMQGLADGYFILPNTIGDYLADFLNQSPVPVDDPVFAEAETGVAGRVERFVSARGSRTVDWFHKELGKIMLEYCGMSRSEPGLNKALSEIPALYDEFKKDVKILGAAGGLNQTLERAGRVEDFFELAQAMCLDAVHRDESCGGHFREEYQTAEGEALRRDDEFAHVAVWEWTGDPARPALNIEPLEFENVALTTRSYK